MTARPLRTALASTFVLLAALIAPDARYLALVVMTVALTVTIGRASRALVRWVYAPEAKALAAAEADRLADLIARHAHRPAERPLATSREVLAR